MVKARQREYDWRTRPWRDKQHYRAGRTGNTSETGSIISTDPTLAYVDRANVFTLLNTFLEVLATDRLAWKDGTAFEGTFTHGNTGDRAWALPNRNGNLLIVPAGAGDLMIESGSQAFVGATATVTFPVAYPSAPLVVGLIEKAGGLVQAVNIAAPTTTGVVATRSAPAGVATLHWLSIGPHV
jgi:hypothetical protein